jgi:hypothetical protein
VRSADQEKQTQSEEATEEDFFPIKSRAPFSFDLNVPNEIPHKAQMNPLRRSMSQVTPPSLPPRLSLPHLDTPPPPFLVHSGPCSCELNQGCCLPSRLCPSCRYEGKKDVCHPTKWSQSQFGPFDPFDLSSPVSHPNPQ